MPDKFVLQNGKCRAKNAPCVRHGRPNTRICATPTPFARQFCRANQNCRAKTTTRATTELNQQPMPPSPYESAKPCAANDHLSRKRQTIPRKPNKAATDSWHTRTYQPSTRRNAATTSMRAKSPSVAPIHQSISSVWTKTCGKPTFSLEWRDHCASKWR